jgi:membrane protease YdiL (CAAX protease family)
MNQPEPRHDGFRHGPRFVAARAISLAVVALAVVLPVFRADPFETAEWALIGLLAVLVIGRGDVPTLGLRLTPIQGWRYWVRVALWFGACIALLSLIAAWIFYLRGWEIPIPRYEPMLRSFTSMCVTVPVAEEVIYRALLATALFPSLGARWTIVAGGVLFALVHVIRGNPGPDNQIAGFLLMWAFLHSGTIVFPLAMHAAGNMIAFTLHAAVWHGFVPL